MSKPNWGEKPNKDFPLYPHASGYWAKKIHKKLYYFGDRYCHPDEAYAEFVKDRDSLYAGIGRNTAGLWVDEACGIFLDAKKRMVESGSMSFRTYKEYSATCKRFSDRFGKTTSILSIGPSDFEKYRMEMRKKWGPVTLSNEIRRLRVMFKYLVESETIERPVRTGPLFKEASERELRASRHSKARRLFCPEQVRNLIKSSDSYLKPSILLGINCAFGNTDVGDLPVSAVNLSTGWINFPRGKTAITRRCPLWPETIQALDEWLSSKQRLKYETDLVFITERGRPVCGYDTSRSDAVGGAFNKLLTKLEMKHPGVNFYALRKTFNTVAESSKDFPAVRIITGHADQSVDVPSLYREHVEDSRLIAVSNHVRQWIFSGSGS